MQEKQRLEYLDALSTENSVIAQTIEEINGEIPEGTASAAGDETPPRIQKILMATDALKACGLQPEFAAQLLFLCHFLSNFVVLRAGSPPAYDDPAIPKGMQNKTKTSGHGFLGPYLAVKPIFGRLEGTKIDPSLVKRSSNKIIPWEETHQEARSASNIGLTSEPSTASADAATSSKSAIFNWTFPICSDDSELVYEPPQLHENILTAKKLDTKDARSLQQDPFDIAKYQHKIILRVRLIDILNQLDDSGELLVAGYENGLLFLKNRDNVAHRHASGMFVIDFLQQMEPDELPRIYSRRWNHPINHKLWDPKKKVLKKIEALKYIPDELYIKANSLRFKVYYTEHKRIDLEILKVVRSIPAEDRVKPPAIPGLEGVFIFAHLPKKYKEIYRALKIENYLPADIDHISVSQEVDGSADITALLEACFKRDGDTSRLLVFFDSIAQPITGDCDGLVFGQNINTDEIITFLRESGVELPERGVYSDDKFLLDFEFTYLTYKTSVTKMLSVYGVTTDTAITLQRLANEKKDFLHASNVYLNYQRWRCKKWNFLFPDDIEISVEDIKHFGIATPHDLVFNLLSNYFYADKQLSFYGNNSYEGIKIVPLLTECFKIALSQMISFEKSHSEALRIAMLELKARVFAVRNKPIANQAAQEQKQKQVVEQQELGYHQHILEDYFAYHLAAAKKFEAKKACIDASTEEYVLPHPDYDNNIQHLFQHAYDMRNPGNLNIKGPWLMITAGGLIIYGETQEQLVAILLSGNDCVLKNSFIDISPKVDMQLWSKVIAKQLELRQPVSQKTRDAYETFLHPERLEKKIDEGDGFTLLFFKPRQPKSVASFSDHSNTNTVED